MHELENTLAAQSTTEEDAPNNAVDHPNDAELPTGADNSNGDVQFRILGNGRGLSSDILSTIQRQLQSMVDGEVGTNVVEGNEMNIEGLGSALSTMGSEEDAGSNSGELDMHQLQRALFSSLQALGSSTTTTTTTTTTSPSGEVSQLVYVAVATNGAPQIRLALPVSDDVSVDNLLSSDTLVMSLDNLDSMLHGARIARSNGDGSSDGHTPQDPLLASITAGRHALVKFNEDSKYYSALIAGHMEDGTYQILYKGVDPWISAIFNWDGPTYPNQSVNGGFHT